ncbi:MAG: hypothetical protein KGI04_02000 [Candidatus Micrarchaeota archaeon]|nr:hypothetical protein [Candidatus Micrarchaeota archaeon]
MIETIFAPSSTKLAGEHTVVLGTDCISAAVDKPAKTRVETISDSKIKINLSDEKFKASRSFSSEELTSLFRSWKEKKSIDSFITENKELSGTMLAFAHIAARAKVEFGLDIMGSEFTSSSTVPTQSGWGSSTSIGASFAGGLLARANTLLKDSETIDLMRDMDRITHRNPNAGGIDVPPLFFGGYVFGSPKRGYVNIDVRTQFNFLAPFVGRKQPTSSMVFVVDVRKHTYPESTRSICDSVQRIVGEEVVALQESDASGLGRLMFENHRLLKELWVSSEKLDEMVSIAEKWGAYGAKLVGGGGDGAGLINCDPELNSTMIQMMRRSGFSCEQIEITDIGVKRQLEAIIR